MQIAIPVGVVKALLRFAAKKDVRFYLNGVMIEYGPLGAVAVATNGAILLAHRIEQAGMEPATQAGSIIVPRESLELALKAAGKAVVLLVEFAEAVPTDGQDNRNVAISAGAAHTGGIEIRGKYPEWRRVFPARTSGELANYNPEFLATAYAAMQDIRKGARWPGIAYNGRGAGLVTINDDTQALVMPLNDTAGNPEALPWIKEPLTADAVPA